MSQDRVSQPHHSNAQDSGALEPDMQSSARGGESSAFSAPRISTGGLTVTLGMTSEGAGSTEATVTGVWPAATPGDACQALLQRLHVAPP